MPELIKPLESLARSNLDIELSYVDIARRGMPVENAEILVAETDTGYVIGFSLGVKAIMGLDVNKNVEHPIWHLDLPFETNAVNLSFLEGICTIHRTGEKFPRDKLPYERVPWADYQQRRRELQE
jgi:hypothetical protein